MIRGLIVAVMMAVPGVLTAQRADAPLVLVVHGRGQLGRDSAQVRREIWHSLEAGIHTGGGDFSFAERDVKLVWYADILDARSAGIAIPACAAPRDSLSTSAGTTNAVTALAALASVLLDAASSNAIGDDAMTVRGFAGDLRYLADDDTRCAAENRVRAALRQAKLEHRPVIVISHSLGALVTWGALRGADRDSTLPPIEEWITMGSPLGSVELRQLVFGDARERLALPERVHEWVNVMRDGDPFATAVARAEDDPAGTHISDVHTGAVTDDPHAIASYLNSDATARALIRAWRAAH